MSRVGEDDGLIGGTTIELEVEKVLIESSGFADEDLIAKLINIEDQAQVDLMNERKRACDLELMIELLQNELLSLKKNQRSSSESGVLVDDMVESLRVKCGNHSKAPRILGAAVRAQKISHQAVELKSAIAEKSNIKELDKR
mmetsp:Transcript_6036/g.10721  ORF Transcript_6036/g.10721 Transcript_6036/m.10721 type:complete len:142 (-) Transcript_6036:382-807(-)